MMTDARVLLLDEPGAGVNPTLKNKLCDDIQEAYLGSAAGRDRHV